MNREEMIKEWVNKSDEAYLKRTKKSRAALKAAAKVLPGGDSRTSTFYYPYPIFIDQGKGCRIKDVDGNEFLDFHNCYTALIHGHAYPPIVQATRKLAGRFATALGAPTTLIAEWAETICRRVKSVRKIRFCNSGTEAGMLAIRTARAFSGKDKILKIKGGYHGSYDDVVHPANAAGLAKSVQSEQLTIPFNDPGAAERAIVENKDQLACLIVEGMMGAAGQIRPRDGYLEHLRKVTQENGVLMILDEVMHFRLHYGGLQRIYSIEPDLTMFGKIIGGGYAVGALGGREDIMELFDPIKGQALIQDSPGLSATAKLFHGGTFNANPMVATAGKIMVENLTAKEIARINKLGESLAEGIRNIFSRLRIKGQVTGIGSLQNLHFTPEPVVDFKTAQTDRHELMHLVHMGLLQRGIFIPARGLFALSTAITQKEIDMTLSAMDDLMTGLKPQIEQAWPELLE